MAINSNPGQTSTGGPSQTSRPNQPETVSQGVSMLLKHTLLYLPAQFLGPLSQFAALLLWTHFADGRTVGAVTLITATQELLSATLLGFWSQYVLRHMGGLVKAGHGAALRSTATYVL